MKILHTLLGFLVWSQAGAEQKQLVDFFQPMAPQGELVSDGVWGAETVVPRDVANGLEDPDMSDWCYWDGKIVKDDEGKYHMYASRWAQSNHHSVGWNKASHGVHAVSDSLLGPYRDLGAAWPEWNGGSGHNVIGLRMSDGRFAMVSSEVTPGDVFVSESPTGPWEYHGALQIESNGFYRGLARYDELDRGAVKAGTVGHMANVMIITRPDGRYMIVARHCTPMISDAGILGPYRIMADKAWRDVEGVPQFKMEDPTVWYSDGLYHIVVNHYTKDITYHLTSEDGIHNWVNRGLAFHHDKGIFRYPDGTKNEWRTVQRPTVYTEDGMVKAFNFSVIDVHKGKDQGNDEHGSKIVVVPFDGEGFNEHIRPIVDEENRLVDETPAPARWKSVDIGSVAQPGNTGFDRTHETFRVKASGNDFAGEKDAFRFVYREMTGDVSATVLVMAQDISPEPVKAGLMFRQDLGKGSAYVSTTISQPAGFRFEKRDLAGSHSTLLAGKKELQAPYWLRIEKRGEQVMAFASPNNHFNWTKLGQIKFPLGSKFFVGMVASAVNNGSLSLARFKGVDVHQWGNPVNEGVISHSFPDRISTAGEVTFEVEYENHQTLDVLVELQNVHTTIKCKALRKRLGNKGTMELSYKFDRELKSGEEYWFVLKTIPMHGHENSAIQSTFKKVFVK